MTSALFSPRPGGLAAVAATTTSDRVKIAGDPSGAVQVRVYNEGTTLAFVEFGDVTVSASATASHPIPPGIPCGFTLHNPMNAPARYMAAIMASGTGRVSVAVGTGI